MLRCFRYGGKGNGHGLDSIVYRKAGCCTDIYYMYTNYRYSTIHRQNVEVKNADGKKTSMDKTSNEKNPEWNKTLNRKNADRWLSKGLHCCHV
jgi:hypothetical protein